jgi:hypothetical protein
MNSNTITSKLKKVFGFLMFTMIFKIAVSQGVYAQPTVPGTTTFGTTPAIINNGTANPSGDSNGFTATVLTNNANNALIALEASFNAGSGTDMDLAFTDGGALNTTITQISLKSDDGSEFKLNTFEFAMQSDADQTVTMTGYKNNAVVTGATQIITVTRTGFDFSTMVDVSADVDFGDIDEIRLSSDNTGLNYWFFDDIVLAAAVVTVSLPHTLNFSTADDTDLGIVANDGEGGSSNITGRVFNIFISDAAGVATGGTIIYDDFGGGYEGLSATGTPGAVAFKGMVIETADGSEFDFNGFSAAEYGFVATTLKIEGFKDGLSTGSTTVALGAFATLTAYNSGNFSDAIFGDVDEVQITENVGGDLFVAINAFVLANTSSTPSCIAISPPAGATNTWMGCTDSDWSNGANWSTGVVPVTSDVIYVPNNPDNPLIINEVATCAKMIVQIGGICKVDYNAGGKLVVQF